VNCTQTQNLLHAYFDRELDLVRHLEIEHHLQDCPECARSHESLQALRSGLSAESLYYKASPALRERLRSSPANAGVAVTTPSRRMPLRWIGIATSMAAAILLGISAGWLLWARTAPTEISVADKNVAQDVVASHVRSLMERHLVDIESSNRHVVKPWFIGKVDIAPQVRDDLNVEGFTLLGGRLDYVDNRPVAAIVYKKGEHKINLFLWRADLEASDGVQRMVLQGHEVRHWVQVGVNFWLVSDLNGSDLDEFVRRAREN
jgi:anti-sigma factor RsiW